ncbi:MAG: hypothetical protein E7Z91_06170 [Cyanobacteria bacterium SIG30]|nr:hypothetical protein [Cyanobacteria bacterium SIG30]
MKKFLIILSLIIFSSLSAKADYIPISINSIQHYGIGVMRLNRIVNIYKDKDENSEIIQKIYWDNAQNFNNKLKKSEEKTFVAFFPKNDFAFLSVEDEQEDWYLVCFDQENKSFGWVKQGESAKFYTWQDFIMKFGQKKGIYYFEEIKDKFLYAKPDENSQIVDEWKYAKFIQPWYINGNWMIVKVLDYDNNQKTGYMRWRTDDGKLLIFAKLRY